MRTLLYAFFLIFIGSRCLAATTLTVGISTGYPPYYYEENETVTGLCVDIINGVAQEMHLDINYKIFPWKRLLANARKGSVDAIMPLFRTKEREQFLYFDGLGIAFETNHFFTRKDFPVKYNGDFQNIEKYNLGVVTDYSYGEAFDTYQNFHKVVTTSDKHLIEMFAHHRFDIGVGNRYVTLFYANKQNVGDKNKFIEPPITKEMLYFGITRKGDHHQLAKQFAEALQRFKKTRKYQNIYQKYKLSDEEQSSLGHGKK